MKKGIAVVVCIFGTAACGGSNDKPAQDPSIFAGAEVSPLGESTVVAESTTTAVASTPDLTPVPPAPTTTAAIVTIGVSEHTEPTPAPIEQGSSESDRKITATIRKGLAGDKTLSSMGKNVKVITAGSKVTLRGTVKSDDEKASIEARAKQTQGVTDVDSELEVKK